MSHDTAPLIIGLLIGALVWAAVGALVADHKGRQVSVGIIYGVLLGWIGVVILALLPSNFTRCPYCGGKVRKVAVVCPCCRHRLKGD